MQTATKKAVRFTPAAGRVLLELHSAPEQNAAGLYVVTKSRPYVGTVLAVGPNSEAEVAPEWLKPGAVVHFEESSVRAMLEERDAQRGKVKKGVRLEPCTLPAVELNEKTYRAAWFSQIIGMETA